MSLQNTTMTSAADLMELITSLSQRRVGWYDGVEGAVFDPATISAARKFVRWISCGVYPLPKVTPTTEGTIILTWTGNLVLNGRATFYTNKISYLDFTSSKYDKDFNITKLRYLADLVIDMHEDFASSSKDSESKRKNKSKKSRKTKITKSENSPQNIAIGQNNESDDETISDIGADGGLGVDVDVGNADDVENINIDDFNLDEIKSQFQQLADMLRPF